MEQLSLFMPLDITKSNEYNTEMIECLFNGERGLHSFNDMRISKNQYRTMIAVQNDAYKKYIGEIIGDFLVLGIEYDWGTHKQMWKVCCNTCGEISYKPDGYQWSRGKMYSRRCEKCKERIKNDLAQKRLEEKTQKEEKRKAEINEELNKMYGRYQVVEYKGCDTCKVKCIKCGAIRRKGVAISKLRNGIYPDCDCGKPKYADWVGKRICHLVVEKHEGGNFICKCDCGRERIVNQTFFARKRYLYCGDLNCEYVSEAKRAALNARLRGDTYEVIAEALLKSNGYKTRHTGKTGDFGVDVIAIAEDGTKVAVQCKSNMTKATGVDAVQQVYAGGRYYGLEHFAVISHSGYSVNAVKMAKRLGVYLSDGQTFEYPLDIKKYANELIPTCNAAKHIKAQKLYEMNGKKKTIANWAFEFGVSEYCVRAGLNKGLTLENALQYRPGGKHKMYTYKGFTGTITEICREFKVGVTTQTIHNRINKGMNIEEAIAFKSHIGRPTKQ